MYHVKKYGPESYLICSSFASFTVVLQDVATLGVPASGRLIIVKLGRSIEVRYKLA